MVRDVALLYILPPFMTRSLAMLHTIPQHTHPPQPILLLARKQHKQRGPARLSKQSTPMSLMPSQVPPHRLRHRRVVLVMIMRPAARLPVVTLRRRCIGTRSRLYGGRAFGRAAWRCGGGGGGGEGSRWWEGSWYRAGKAGAGE